MRPLRRAVFRVPTAAAPRFSAVLRGFRDFQRCFEGSAPARAASRDASSASVAASATCVSAIRLDFRRNVDRMFRHATAPRRAHILKCGSRPVGNERRVGARVDVLELRDRDEHFVEAIGDEEVAVARACGARRGGGCEGCGGPAPEHGFLCTDSQTRERAWIDDV